MPRRKGRPYPARATAHVEGVGVKERLQETVARFNGHCAECGRSIVRNAPIVYDTKLKRTLCKACGDFQAFADGQLFAK